MNIIREAIIAFEKLEANLEQIVYDTIEQTSECLTDDIKRQLFAGTDGTGSKIQPRYISAKYASRKYTMNSQPGLFVPDLKYSANFYEGLFAMVQKPNLLIGSSVDYSSYLSEKYGEKIFEPTRSNLNNYVTDYFLPAFFTNVEKICGIRFTK